MNCRKVADLMSDYLDGCLADHIRSEVALHLGKCSRCAAELQEMGCMVSSLRALSEHRSPVNCWEAVQSQIVESGVRRSVWWNWVLRPVVAAPALAVAAMFIAFVMWFSPVPQPMTEVASNLEYSRYISAHSRLQREQAFTDPDVTFVAAELETANISPSQNGR